MMQEAHGSGHHYLTPAEAARPPVAGQPGTPLQLPGTAHSKNILSIKWLGLGFFYINSQDN